MIPPTLAGGLTSVALWGLVRVGYGATLSACIQIDTEPTAAET